MFYRACMCVCMYVCVCMFVCMCMHACMYICVCMFVCICMFVCMCMHVCMYMYVCMWCMARPGCGDGNQRHLTNTIVGMRLTHRPRVNQNQGCNLTLFSVCAQHFTSPPSPQQYKSYACELRTSRQTTNNNRRKQIRSYTSCRQCQNMYSHDVQRRTILHIVLCLNLLAWLEMIQVWTWVGHQAYI